MLKVLLKPGFTLKYLLLHSKTLQRVTISLLDLDRHWRGSMTVIRDACRFNSVIQNNDDDSKHRNGELATSDPLTEPPQPL